MGGVEMDIPDSPLANLVELVGPELKANIQELKEDKDMVQAPIASPEPTTAGLRRDASFVLPPPPAPPRGALPDPKRRRLQRTYSAGMGSSPGLYPELPPRSPSGFSIGFSEPSEVSDWWTVDLLEPDSPLALAVLELRKYVSEWVAVHKDPFWHRKSGKPVLCVVICSDEDGRLTPYRGMNTEVSLPAGSLCAERAAIARSASDFRAAASIVAIAALDPADKLNPLWPCEVCQSWLSKLRSQNQNISVLAMQSVACEAFAVRVNGELKPPALPQLPPSPGGAGQWQENVELPDGANELPWEAKETVYVDGAWTFLHAAQQGILQASRAKGTHLLVGVHSDSVLKREFDGPVLENFETRLGRVLQNRHVSSVLKGAPWQVTANLIQSLGIRRVITGSVCKTQDVGMLKNGSAASDPYRDARDLGILEVIPSLDETTERSVYEAHVARARL